jgi:hypothetical protein
MHKHIPLHVADKVINSQTNEQLFRLLLGFRPAISSVTTFLLSKVRNNKAGGL